jgi:hypothetical protein
VILVAIEAARGLLQWEWSEMDYRLDICRVTGADTQNAQKNLENFPINLYVLCYKASHYPIRIL